MYYFCSMQFLEWIRRLIFRFILRRNDHARYERKPVPLENAKRIGILFHAGNIAANDAILRFSQHLKASLKEVQLLAYLPKREFGFNYPFPYLTTKDTNWFGKPGGKETEYFVHTHFDLLINFCPESCLPLDYIAALSPAQFRVGYNPDSDIANYDLILITKEKSDISAQIENLEHYLK